MHLLGIQGGSTRQQNMANTTPSPPVATMPHTIHQNRQRTNLATLVEQAQEALETIFGRKLSWAFELNPPANPKPSFICSNPITSRTITPPSKHNLYNWLKANMDTLSEYGMGQVDVSAQHLGGTAGPNHGSLQGKPARHPILLPILSLLPSQSFSSSVQTKSGPMTLNPHGIELNIL